jgi:cystathionine beta-lyase family protein involved in aluminum resistance
MYEEFKISKEIEELANEVEKEIKPEFEKVDKICELNSLKVLKAMQDNNLSSTHFNTSTGYGIDESGRDKIEEIYSQIFKAEDSLVRSQLISGSHALTVTLQGLLRPGDILLSITGLPYDTLQTVIGIGENPGPSSLKSFNIKYEQIDLKDNEFDTEKIVKRLSENNVKVVEIQRSIGYSTRKSLCIEKVEEIIREIRKVNKDVIIMVDNCYCEFVTEKEPIEVGADIAVGSLIKNLGAGIATSGAYVVGKKELISLVADRLTGLGKEIGPSLGQNTNYLKGLFFAPSVVASSLKTMIFASRMLERLGYNTSPKYNEPRADIVQNIIFNDKEKLIKFCQGIQSGSPIDSYVTPVPSPMAGYEDEVIMAAGTFVDGATIELSCDAPLREPYIAYMQGSLTYQYGKIGVLKAIEYMKK